MSSPVPRTPRPLLGVDIAYALLIADRLPIAPSSPSSSPLTTTSSTAQPLRIAFLYYGKISDGGWTQAHEEGRQALVSAIPGLQTIYLEDTPDGPEAVPVLRKLAEEGYDLIVSTSIVFADAVLSVADEFPQVRFLQCEGDQTTANISTYYGKIGEPFYLAGLLAGSTTQTNQIGFVAAYPLDDIIREIDAFTLGARRANSEATVVVRDDGLGGPGKRAIRNHHTDRYRL